MKVGVTGGIGAGKSSVCRAFERAGARVVEADAVGHETLADPAVVRELAAAFGPDVVDGEGRVVRRELGRRAFASPRGRARLNAIVWPPLGRRLKARVQAALDCRPGRPVVIDAALLVEWGDPKTFCDVLVVVTAPREVRIARTMQRMGLSREEVEARMASQLPDEEKAKLADYVIENDGTEAELEEKALAVWRAIVSG